MKRERNRETARVREKERKRVYLYTLDAAYDALVPRRVAVRCCTLCVCRSEATFVATGAEDDRLGADNEPEAATKMVCRGEV